jgi:hypothetical protein
MGLKLAGGPILGCCKAADRSNYNTHRKNKGCKEQLLTRKSLAPHNQSTGCLIQKIVLYKLYQSL